MFESNDPGLEYVNRLLKRRGPEDGTLRRPQHHGSSLHLSVKDLFFVLVLGVSPFIALALTVVFFR